jgi:hypothetical protein
MTKSSHASTQQPADFFCKVIRPGQHRLESPVLFSFFSGEWFRGNSRPRRSRVCEPWRCFAVRDSEQFRLGHPSRKTWEVHSSLAHQFTESKPQQTGTGLLIRFGEVATTSGSTRFSDEETPFELDQSTETIAARTPGGTRANCPRYARRPSPWR